MIFKALFIIYKRTFHVKDYVGQLLVHVCVLLSCSWYVNMRYLTNKRW